MNDVLLLSHFRQAAEGTCLPACVRMVLDYLGQKYSEEEIARVLGTREFGTPSFAVQRLAALDFQVTYREWSVSQLLTAIQARSPLIAFVRTAFLDHWTIDVAHAVVVVGAVENQQFWIHDPARSTGPLTVAWNGLLAAWAEFSYRGAVITAQAKRNS